MTVSAKAISQCTVREESQIMEGHKNGKLLEHVSSHAKNIETIIAFKKLPISKKLKIS